MERGSRHGESFQELRTIKADSIFWRLQESASATPGLVLQKIREHAQFQSLIQEAAMEIRAEYRTCVLAEGGGIIAIG